jgi:4-hydroxy-tetrahydrodipicolinate reductase
MKKNLNIALIGYGKMGREIEKHASAQGHAIHVIIDREEDWKTKEASLKQSDVAIEFTAPQSAPANIERCFSLGVPVVCGTTGWHEELPRIARLCGQKGGTLLHASNFSLGVNIFFELNRKLAAMLAPFDNYLVSMSETHHIQKADAPSGTAVTLAQDIVGMPFQRTEKLGTLRKKSQREDDCPLKLCAWRM